MNKFFFPNSIAIFGVSSSPSNLAQIIVENLDRCGFKGDLFLIGDKDEQILGRKVYRSVEDVEVVPDQVVFLIPAKGLPKALDVCGRKGIRHAVIESGGFSEFDEGRKELEDEILHIAQQWDMQILGPNCVGIINMLNGLTLPFYPVNPQYITQGPVSLISQSGGLIHDIMVLSCCENVGMSKLISLGNKLMLDENDFLEFLIHDPHTRIIGIYLESIQDGRRFMTLASSTDKPIILLKSNISPASTRIAQFHTAALAGNEQVLDAALTQAGVHRVQSIQEMVECFKIFLLPRIKGQRLAFMSRSGGHAVLSADGAHRHGFYLADFSDDVFDIVKDKSKAGVIRMTNPLDLGDVFDISAYSRLAENILKQEGVDGLVVIHSYAFNNDVDPTKDFLRTLSDIMRQYEKPIIFCMVAHRENWFTMKEAAEFPIFTDVDTALRMLAKNFHHYRFHETSFRTAWNGTQGKKAGTQGNMNRTNIMPPDEVFRLLRAYNIPVAPYAIVRTIEEAVVAAHTIGYPVVLKTASPDILHKTDAGGVILNITHDEELTQAFTRIQTASYLIQKMYTGGIEVLIGGACDPHFGSVILFGFGGIYAEMFSHVALRIVPVNETMAIEMIDEIKASGILKGFRGEHESDREALADIILNVSRLLMEHPEIIHLDINPLIVFEKGRGCMAVDSKIEYQSISE